MPAIRKRIGDHPVLAFFVGAYAIAWSVWIPVPTAIDRGVIAYDATAIVVLVAGVLLTFGWRTLARGGVAGAARAGADRQASGEESRLPQPTD
jgi:hypothetical protein